VSTFSGLNTASTALWSHRRALDVTGQNIANANTEGYSRQRVGLQAMGGSVVPAFYSVSSGIGQGVSVDEVARIRDAFLEGRGHLEHARTSALAAESEALSFIEQAFREPGDTGVQSLLGEMWAGWEDVTNAPNDLPARSQLLQRMDTLVDGIRFTQSTLDAEWNATRSDLEVLVDEVNTATALLADLNLAIRNAKSSGLPANELSDRRDVLAMELADKIGATVRHGEQGVVTVSVGGINLVSEGRATALVVAGSTDVNTAAGDKPRIETATAGYTVRAGGQVSGQLTALNTIIPDQRAGLDEVARRLANDLNAAHTSNAWDYDGNPGQPLLGSSSGPITASTLTLLVTDPREVAASAFPDDGQGNPSTDSSVADTIAQLRLTPAGADARYRQLIVDLGVQSAVTARNLGIQQVIATQVDAARESVAGVNIDEEMTNMLSSQHAYAAAGRLVTAIDETLDLLINRTGLVGR
jgi:flagellar hook-associated protein 1 FlgK